MSAENNSFERITLSDNFASTLYFGEKQLLRMAGINPHPWLNDLRAMARMLEGAIKLPHDIKLCGNARQRRKQRRAEERGVSTLRKHPSGYRYNTARCRICLAAAKQRRAYQRQKAS